MGVWLFVVGFVFGVLVCGGVGGGGGGGGWGGVGWWEWYENISRYAEVLVWYVVLTGS